MSDESPAVGPAEPALARAETLDALLRSGLLSPEQAATLDAEFPPGALPQRPLGRALMARGWLTAFQANRLLSGRAAELSVGGKYLLCDVIGEGGMGQVFRARHLALGRPVALKVIRPGRAGPDMVRRFEREVRAAARLSPHPNVAAALDAGEAAGSLYLVMELVEGKDLARLIKESGPLPVPLACEYARQAALGLQHAHEAGLVHRDVKPSNLIVTPAGVVKLLDLGLARIAADGDETSSSLTESGVVAGTPDYIAPEQVMDTHRADTRADLYSLGCTLYHLIGGRAPFAGSSPGQKLVLHQTKEPPPLASLRPDVPAAVAAFVARLMAKTPEGRYATPGEAAAVLARLLAEGRCVERSEFEGLVDTSALIQPPRPSRPEGISRRALLAGAAGAGAVAALAGLGWWLSRPPHPLPGPPPPPPPTDPLAALRHDTLPVSERSGLVPQEVVQVLGTSAGRHRDGVSGLAFTPDGKHLLSAGHDGVVFVRDGDTLACKDALRLGSPATALALSPDGGTAHAWESGATSGRWSWEWRKGQRGVLGRGADGLAQCLSPDGARALYAWSSRIELLDASSGKAIFSLKQKIEAPLHGHLGRAFSPDSKLALVSGGRMGEVLLLDAVSGEMIRRFEKAHDHWVTALAFLPDGSGFLSGGYEGLIRRHALTGGPPSFTLSHGSYVTCLAVSPDGKRAVSGGVTVLRFWDVERPRAAHSFKTGGTRVVAAAFRPDGAVAAGDESGRVRLFDAAGEERSPPWPLAFPAGSVAVTPAGAVLASGGAVALWPTPRRAPAWALDEPSGVHAVALSPDGEAALIAGLNGMLRLRRVSDGGLVRTLEGVTAHVRAAAFIPGTRLAAAAGGQAAKAPPGSHIPTWPLNDCAIHLWDIDTGKVTGRLLAHTSPVVSLSVSADGTRLLSGSTGPTDAPDRSLRLWDVRDGRTLWHARSRWDAAIHAVALSPDGTLAAAATSDPAHALHLYDLRVEAGVPAAEPRGHIAPLTAVCFSPDGGRIFTADGAGMVRAWTPAGRPDGQCRLAGRVNALAAFNARHVACANNDGTVYVLRPGKPG